MKKGEEKWKKKVTLPSIMLKDVNVVLFVFICFCLVLFVFVLFCDEMKYNILIFHNLKKKKMKKEEKNGKKAALLMFLFVFVCFCYFWQK